MMALNIRYFSDYGPNKYLLFCHTVSYFVFCCTWQKCCFFTLSFDFSHATLHITFSPFITALTSWTPCWNFSALHCSSICIPKYSVVSLEKVLTPQKAKVWVKQPPTLFAWLSGKIRKNYVKKRLLMTDMK